MVLKKNADGNEHVIYSRVQETDTENSFQISSYRNVNTSEISYHSNKIVSLCSNETKAAGTLTRLHRVSVPNGDRYKMTKVTV